MDLPCHGRWYRNRLLCSVRTDYVTGLSVGTTPIPNVIGLVNVALRLKKTWYGASVNTCGCSGS